MNSRTNRTADVVSRGQTAFFRFSLGWRKKGKRKKAVWPRETTADAITRTIRAPGSREEKANRSTTKILRRGARKREHLLQLKSRYVLIVLHVSRFCHIDFMYLYGYYNLQIVYENVTENYE